MAEEKLISDASYYWSVYMLRRLRDAGLLSDGEYEKIRIISAGYYGTEIYAN